MGKRHAITNFHIVLFIKKVTKRELHAQDEYILAITEKVISKVGCLSKYKKVI